MVRVEPWKGGPPTDNAAIVTRVLASGNVDLSIFEVVHGAVSVLDARLGVLHLYVRSPLHYLGITDLSATIKVSDWYD